jgi:hypothetical protein
MAKKNKCGAKYVSRRINNLPMYSYCGKKKGHWGGHGKGGWFG